MSASAQSTPDQPLAPVLADQSFAPDPTLHDFVLTLLTDEAARSAFTADPAAALTGAGLGDITAQDVQDVVPLVLDYADTGANPVDLGAVDLGGDPISGLSSVAAAAGAGDSELRFDGTDVAASTAGANSAVGYLADVETDGHSLSGAGVLETDQLTADGYLDASLSRVTAATSGETQFGDYRTGLVASTDGVAAEASAGAFTAGTEFDGGTATGGFALGTGGVDAGAGFAASTAGVAGTVEFGQSTLGVEVSGSGASAVTPLGDIDLDSSIDPTSALDFGSDLNGLVDPTALLDGPLDAGDLLRGGDLSAGTVADYVSSGGELLGSAPGNLGGFLTNVPGAVTLPTSPADVLDQAQLADLPAVDQLPVDLPADLPTDLPGALPVDVPADLPVDLPTDHLPTDLHGALPELPHLPVDLPTEIPALPDLPVANPLPDVTSGVTESVGGLVGGTPLGGEHADLPDVGGLAGDLGLGH
ncbi:IniB N-terminal domain-containing protein [Actinokineospora auranticolor]|uniref:Uncharacterized protein n=1 Tax=Actinokineospora auranticolor TaxID=155976 RepID=A0A2S6GFT4_9PSEU|nr:IniB N-terminal domain-containing protein [Actinokineospora auranticolor]PPK64045.1 hypothetical protein CLV40_12236 [Actinokineospora auranticolor]